VIAVVVLACSREAGAIGMCEDVAIHYRAPTLYSESDNAFAVPATQDWCDAGTVDDKRGTIELVELRGIDGKVVAILSTVTGADAAHLTAAVGGFVAVPDLAHALEQRGYVPLVASSRCTVAITWSRAPAPDPWPPIAMGLAIAGSSKLALGIAAAARKGDALVRAHVLPKRHAIAIWALLPTCAGPPPGYFGSDDAGMCYPVDTPIVKLVTGATCT
jgi:hypothetical protein